MKTRQPVSILYRCLQVVGVAFTVTLIEANVLYPATTPPSAQLRYPYNVLAVPGSVLLFIALMSCIRFESDGSIRNKRIMLGLWCGLLFYWVLFWVAQLV